MNMVSVETLRTWLEEHRDVLVLDVRTTADYEVEQQVDLLHVSRADFVQRLLGRLPVTPPNYMQIVKLNEQERFPNAPLTELEAGANRCAIS